MKTIQKFAFALSLFPVLASATSLHPGSFSNEVAPVIRTLKVDKVGTQGTILRSRSEHPYSYYLIGIPADVSTGSACTSFVGQESVVKRTNLLSVRALGASDPVNDACIEIFPAPVATQLTIEMKILTGGFVPAQPVQTQFVEIVGKGTYQVTLDMEHQTVSIRPAFQLHH